MLKHRKIKIGKGQIEALEFDLGKKRLIVLKGKRGYLMCGYLNLKTAQKFRDPAAKIIGIANIAQALKTKVSASTPQARRLGIYPGQAVREALKLIVK